MSIDQKTSLLIAQQLPQYIRGEYPNFILFLEAYYEWMELNGNALEFNKNLLNNQDIDLTLENYISYFRKEFLSRLPEVLYIDPLDSNRKVDKRKLLKNIKQFYRARGTEKSYQFLFRILFDQEIQFYYPRVDMLRVSDGKWYQDITIRVNQLTGNVYDWKGQYIKGSISGSQAFVEHIQKILVGPLVVYEIFLNRSSINGKFLPEETITSSSISNTTAKTYSLLTGINLTNSGLGYSIGDIIEVTQTGPGYNGKAKVSNVDSTGKILKIDIVDFGAGYSTGIPYYDIQFVSTSVVEEALGTGIIGGQTLYPGYYLNDDGKISNSKFIQDSYYYQQFSYVIKINQSLQTYKTIIKELLHPAGLLLFGDFFSENTVNLRSNIPQNQQGSFVLIEKHVGFAPYGFNEPIDIPEDYIIQNYVIDAKCDTTTSISDKLFKITVDQERLGEISDYKLGPSLRSLDQFKFTYIPSENYIDNNSFVSPNLGYASLYGNYQIEQFENINIYNIIEPNKFLIIQTISGVGTYIEDEYVYQGNSVNTPNFKGVVMGYNTFGYLIIKYVDGEFDNSKNLKGSNSLSDYSVKFLTYDTGLAKKINIMPESIIRTTL